MYKDTQGPTIIWHSIVLLQNSILTDYRLYSVIQNCKNIVYTLQFRETMVKQLL